VAQDEDAGLWTSFGAALRLIVGWFCVVIGTLNLLVELDRITDGDTAYVLFHVMLVVGGMVLLSVSQLGRRPGAAGYTTGALVAVAGLLISSVPVTNTVCCMAGFAVRHGYPFSLAARGAGGRWHVDSQHLLADLLFWGHAGLLALVAVAVVRRVVRPRRADTDAENTKQYTHAEPRVGEQVREQEPADD
jgi:hypothetical protein